VIAIPDTRHLKGTPDGDVLELATEEVGFL